MRWTHIAERDSLARTNGVCADGEVVWSWRSNAGAKVAESSANDGGNQAWSPRRARRKPLKPFAQGMPAVAVCPWLLTRVLFFTHTRPRVQRASGIPCSLFEGLEQHTSGAIAPRACSLFPKPLFEN